MPKGLALTIGLNAVDPKHYEGWSGELNACEFDANDMAKIATSSGFDVQKVLTKHATRDTVLSHIQTAANKLHAGDTFFLAYSGHGGQVPDVNGDEEIDAADETWCLYDGQMLDDEIFFQLSRFAEGVRIFSVSDSCHSGTVLKNLLLARTPRSPQTIAYRAMPPDKVQDVYFAHQAFYDGLGKGKKLKNAQQNTKASALLISGCQDNQLSLDGTFNGLFTAKLKQVWNGGNFKGGYKRFHKKISALMPDSQSPNYFRVGPYNPAFESEKPFTIEKP
jgi:hypothetical protein